MSDPLLDCLLELTRLYGRPQHPAFLCAGLPLGAHGLTPGLFARAAKRGGFASKLIRRSLREIDLMLLPMVLLLNENQACLLLGWHDNGDARLLFGDAGQGEVNLTYEQLAARYSGIAISCRPQWNPANPGKADSGDGAHWFWGALRSQKRLFQDVLLAAFLINLLGLALPLYTMNVYDRVVPNFAEDSLWVLSSGIVLVLVFDALMRLTRSHFIELASARIDMQLSAKVMQRVLGLTQRQRPGSVGAFAANLRAFEMVREFITSATLAALIDLPFALLFLLALGWIGWQLVIIPLIGCAFLLVWSYFIQSRMQGLSSATLDAQAARNATLVESLSALESLQAHGGEARIQARWEQASSVLARVHAQLRQLAANSMQAVLSTQQAVNVTMVVTGVYLIHARSLSLGGLIAGTMLAGRAMGPLGQMVGLLLQWANVKNALASLDSIMQDEVVASAGAGGVGTDGAQVAIAAAAMQAKAYAPLPASGDQAASAAGGALAGGIEFRNVHFSYPGASQGALRGVSFKIAAGEKVVIIGRVGSGKSTLQKLVLGLYPLSSGSILFDGIDQRQIPVAALRRAIGYAEQDTRLLLGSVRDNLNLRGVALDDSALWAACEVAGLLEAIKRHPQGLDWPVSERGESLSGGQRQALALARALVADPPMLLLDEPSSALDFSSEAQFKQRLQQFAIGKTMLIITHRASLMELADRLIVLDDGVVVADGARDAVIAALQAGAIGRAA
jgi:ATP-binding cassette subfamily C protein LapB